MVVCCDGYNSICRTCIFPEFRPISVGYSIIRFNARESDAFCSIPEGPEEMENSITYIGFPDGLGLFYFTPDIDGSTEKGKRRITAGFYRKFADLDKVLTDKNGVKRHGSVPYGLMSAEAVAEARQVVQNNFPSYYADILAKSSEDDMCVQIVWDCNPPALHKGRICLNGDAGTLCRPHTGSGALKSITGAIKLAEAFKETQNIDKAIVKWNAEFHPESENQLKVGQQLGEAFVNSEKDWSKMDAISLEKWWNSIVTLKALWEKQH